MNRCTGIVTLAIMFSLITAVAAQGPATAPAPAPATPAQRAYERFKALAGEWRGASTRGWTEKTSYRVIAGESCVMSTSFDAHPKETMVTMFHLDGEHLMLTHYCVARNQPRLRATDIREDGETMTITFTFLDGTNLPARDAGHMDKAVFTFESPDRFKSRWTWYQDGKERWMEEIVYTRAE